MSRDKDFYQNKLNDEVVSNLPPEKEGGIWVNFPIRKMVKKSDFRLTLTTKLMVNEWIKWIVEYNAKASIEKNPSINLPPKWFLYQAHRPAAMYCLMQKLAKQVETRIFYPEANSNDKYEYIVIPRYISKPDGGESKTGFRWSYTYPTHTLNNFTKEEIEKSRKYVNKRLTTELDVPLPKWMVLLLTDSILGITFAVPHTVTEVEFDVRIVQGMLTYFRITPHYKDEN